MTQLQPKKTSTPNRLLTSAQQIYKFGGSSLANSRCYAKVARIIEKNLLPNDLVVVSASGHSTDWLLAIAELGDSLKILVENQATTSDLNAIMTRQFQYSQKIRFHHLAIIHDGFLQPERDRLTRIIEQDCDWIDQQIRLGISADVRLEIIAYGELWSAQILCSLLEKNNFPASWIDARQFLKLHGTNQDYRVDPIASRRYLHQLLKSRQQRVSVITGFIASDCEGKTLNLGRNGSDYSATLIAELTKAPLVTIWTDVAGIYHFDPHLNQNATAVSELNQNLVQTLCALGSPVLHHKTFWPLKQHQTQLSIRSTFSPELKGTQICQKNGFNQQTIVTHKNNLSVLTLKCKDELTAQRLTNVVNHTATHVSNEFCLVVKSTPNEIKILVEEVRYTFWQEVVATAAPCSALTIQNQSSLLALATEAHGEKPYHCYFFEQFLTKTDTTQTEHFNYHNSLVAIIDSPCIDNLANNCFNDWKKFQAITGIFLIGTGNVGTSWLKQFGNQQRNDIGRVVLTANSKQINCFWKALPIASYSNTTETLKSILLESPFKSKLFIDATASESISGLYSWCFENHIHIVTANKICASSSLTEYQQLTELSKVNQLQWKQNATLGAGLPINHCLTDLVECGDHIEQIRGIFSGTLSWLLQSYDGLRPLSELIKQAQQLGYSEPDPRVDLSGKDVARKLVIAARLAGFDLEFDSINAIPVLDEAFLSGNVNEFWQQTATFDRDFHQLWCNANNNQQVLIYEAIFHPLNGAACRIRSVPKNDPLAQITPCDNIFEITSRWYQHNPLIIRGPGAGREVTAAAVQSDVISVLKTIRRTHEFHDRGLPVFT